MKATSLGELARLFLKLGTVAFGGPAAHIAMMQDEVVDRRAWFSRQRFLDLVGATNLIPGPNSTELAIHIGYERAGWAGLLVAGSSFILPAMFIVMARPSCFWWRPGSIRRGSSLREVRSGLPSTCSRGGSMLVDPGDDR